MPWKKVFERSKGRLGTLVSGLAISWWLLGVIGNLQTASWLFKWAQRIGVPSWILFFFLPLIVFAVGVLLVLSSLREIKQEERATGRPLLSPVRYEKRKADGATYGLIIVNDGEPAYEVSIPDIPFFSLVLNFSCDLPSLVKGDGERFCEAWIERGPHDSIDGSFLMEKMVEANLGLLEFRIRYKDGKNRWYESICQLERDVQSPSGIRVRFIEQKETKPQ